MPELAKPDQKMKTLRAFFDDNKLKVAAVLPKHLSLNRQGQLLFTSIYQNPELLDCTPASLVGSIIRGGMLGLEPIGAGGYYLVPFWETKKDRRNVTMIIDYRGTLMLARNSREIASFDVQPVYEKDHFDFAHGTKAFLDHKPVLAKDRGNPKAYYMVATLKGGGTQFEVMSVDEVQHHKDRFSKTWKNLPMKPELDWYGLKTVIKQGCKMLPMSVEAHAAITLDDQADLGIDQDLGAFLDDVDDRAGGSAGSTKLDRVVDEKKKQDEAKTNGKAAEVKPDAKPATAATTSDPGPAPGTAHDGGQHAPVATAAVAQAEHGQGTSAPAPAAAAAPGVPTASLSGLLDVVAQLYTDLKMDGPGDQRKRDFMWGRYVGAGVSPEQADPAKVQNLIQELTALRDKRKK